PRRAGGLAALPQSRRAGFAVHQRRRRGRAGAAGVCSPQQARLPDRVQHRHARRGEAPLEEAVRRGRPRLSCSDTIPVFSTVPPSATVLPRAICMKKLISGKAYVLGDNVDTDQIIPAQYLTYNPAIPAEYKQFGKYALSSVPPSQA